LGGFLCIITNNDSINKNMVFIQSLISRYEIEYSTPQYEGDNFMKTLVLYIVLAMSLFLVQQTNGQFKNWPVNNNSDHQCNPVIAVHPTNPDIQFVAYGDNANPQYYWPGYALSTNRGATWTTDWIQPLSDVEGILEPGCAIDRNGRIYYTYTGHDWNTGRYNIYIAITTNQGASWDTKNLTPSDPLPFHAEPYITIDNTGGSRDGTVYVSWIRASGSYRVHCAVMVGSSTDGGTTWDVASVQQGDYTGTNQPTISSQKTMYPANTQLTGILAYPILNVGGNGNVYVLYADLVPEHSLPMYEASQWIMHYSTDGGASWQNTVNGMPSFTGFRAHSFGYGASMIITSRPSMATDASNGNIYVVYTDSKGPGVDEVSVPNIKFTKWTSGSGSWSTPVAIGNDIGASSTKWEFYPNLVIDASGNLTMAFIHSSDGNLNLFDVFINHSTDAGQNWKKPVRVTSQTIDESNVPDGDYCYYMGFAQAGNQYFPVWTDFRNDDEDIYTTTISKNPNSPWNDNVYLVGSPSYTNLTINAGTVV
jgi:hypothetical protein